MSLSKFFLLTSINFGIQWSLWGVASLLKTEKFYDLAGSSTFGLITCLAYKHSNGHPRAKFQTVAVVCWAVRLGSYLFSRILKDGEDRRFNKARDNPALFFFYWTMQGVWVTVTLLPTLVMLLEPQQPALGSRDYLGWTVWLVGFVTEALADYQKSKFRSDPENKGKFIQSGLWGVSRHPNYLGEITLWFGLYLSASSCFTHLWQHATILSPMFVGFLITRMSGIPLLEAHANKKWGHLPEYQSYIKRTPVLIPFTKFF